MPNFFDNSQLSDYRKCPRSYYLRHRLGWTLDIQRMPLVYGTCMHAALDFLWQQETWNFDTQKGAIEAFMAAWVEEGMPADMSVDELTALGVRSPVYVPDIIDAYMDERQHIFNSSVLLSSEQPFAFPLPIEGEIWLIGRLDKVIQTDNGKVVILEHKTSSEYRVNGGFKNDYIDSWQMSDQVDTYLFAGDLNFEGKVDELWVDALLVHKTARKFKFIPVSQNSDRAAAWLDDAIFWAERIQYSDMSKHWPRNRESCVGKYGKCQFFDVCQFDTKCPGPDDPTPPGYKVEFWEPFNKFGIEQVLGDTKNA